MLPRIRITDLLAEVAGWTSLPNCFTHLRTGEPAADSRILMAGLLADGLNLGLTRMAEACSIASLCQLAWTADWHIREETYALALRRLREGNADAYAGPVGFQVLDADRALMHVDNFFDDGETNARA